jgi:hypothetical protein
MNTEENNQAEVVDSTNNEGEGATQEVETISISKSDYEKLNQTLGSLKRELKDYKKSKETTKETPEKTTTDESKLAEKVEKMALRQAGISHPEDIELARKTAKKWKVDIDDVLGDEDFKVKLEKQQTSRANVEATSGVKGGAGTSGAKFTKEYWIAKGHPPTPAEVPDRKLRASITRSMMESSKSSKKFYND